MKNIQFGWLFYIEILMWFILFFNILTNRNLFEIYIYYDTHIFINLIVSRNT